MIVDENLAARFASYTPNIIMLGGGILPGGAGPRGGRARPPGAGAGWLGGLEARASKRGGAGPAGRGELETGGRFISATWQSGFLCAALSLTKKGRVATYEKGS